MKWLLDTNAVSRHLGGKCPQITVRIKATPPGYLYLCSIVNAEMLYGAWNSPDPKFGFPISQFLNFPIPL
jgi:predicted nucleic acid-binding protein